MNRQLKSQIKSAFEAPSPTRKTEFLQSLPFPKANRFDFILGQIAYIRKRVWLTSCLLLISILPGLHIFSDDNLFHSLWLVSSFLPFVVLVTLTEVARSTSYHMAEMEAACRYHLADIVLLRIGILTGFNLLLFGVIVLSFLDKFDFGLFRLGIYLLLPALLTCALSLLVMNHIRSREALYICGSISCFVGIANALFATMQHSKIFSDDYALSWSILFIALLLCTIKESLKFIKKTEELQWNLS